MSESARFNMVEAQIRSSNVTDPRILAAMSAVAREKFVPSAARALAYADVPVAVAQGRYLLDPRSFAKLLQLAQITATDRVLDVGCGTGYSAAVLARLAAEVVALEQDADLVRIASELLATAVGRVELVQGGLIEGVKGQGAAAGNTAEPACRGRPTGDGYQGRPEPRLAVPETERAGGQTPRFRCRSAAAGRLQKGHGLHLLASGVNSIFADWPQLS